MENKMIGILVVALACVIASDTVGGLLARATPLIVLAWCGVIDADAVVRLADIWGRYDD